MDMDILRLISFGSKSLRVWPSSTLLCLLMMPETKLNDSVRVVLPLLLWPAKTTFLMFAVSVSLTPPFLGKTSQN